MKTRTIGVTTIGVLFAVAGWKIANCGKPLSDSSESDHRTLLYAGRPDPLLGTLEAYFEFRNGRLENVGYPAEVVSNWDSNSDVGLVISSFPCAFPGQRP
jgi:hypothetical protein